MRKQTWWIVLAFLCGLLFAPLLDPPLNTKAADTFVLTTVDTDVQLAAR